jgi:hypothetical protein
MSETQRTDDQQPLIDSISKIVYEMRSLEDLANLIRTDIRNHDDKTQKFYQQNERLGIEISQNSQALIKLDRALNEIITKQNILHIELEAVLQSLGHDKKSETPSGGEDGNEWFKKQLEAYQQSQRDMIDQNRKDNNALLLKILGALIAIALFIAGITGNLTP